jgi:hypothetical protein
VTIRLLLTSLATAALAGGGSTTTQPEPPPVQLEHQQVLDTPPDLTVTGCFGATRVFYRAHSVAAVGNDPTCAGQATR